MRLLVTADTLGGVWTYTRELVTGLSQKGIEVVLVSFGEIPSPAQTEWLDGLRNVDYRATAFKLEWMQDCESDLEASSEFLLDVIAHTKPDLLHLSQCCYGALPVQTPKVVVAHSDVVSWWLAVHGEEPPADRWTRLYREIVHVGMHGADVLIAPSRWMLNAASLHYGKHRQSKVIYNGRNPGLFNPHVSKDDLVVAVGRLWDKAKNVMLLADEKHQMPIWIAGSEKHPDAAFRAEKNLRPSGIRFCGNQSESQLRLMFSRASVYAATSQYEPFGLAPLEAALSRCAIVANDIAPFHELWGDSACYFRYNDSRDLASVLQNLQDQPELRATFANMAYRRANQMFTAERMVNEYLELYRALVPVGAMAA